MLIGTYEASYGLKRRVAIPASFRKILGAKIILAKWYEGCLVLVSEESWSALLEKVKGETGFITQGVRDTDRFILGSAYEVLPDDQGRVVIPLVLALYAGLKEKVSFIGLGDRVEIWDSQTWRQREEYVSAHAAKILEKLANDK